MLLDTTLRTDTPEGCQIELRLAGPITRARAWLLDFLIRVGFYMLSMQVLSWLGDIGFGLWLILIFALEWLYPVIFEVLWQATPGKRIFKLVVLHTDGRPISWNASFIRNTLRFIDFFPFFYGAGLTSMLLTQHSQRLGDLAAGTIVVHQEARKKTESVNTEQLTGEPAEIPLLPDEQRAIIDYVLRMPQLNEARAEELAECAKPLCKNLQGSAARKKLLRIGLFLMGRA